MMPDPHLTPPAPSPTEFEKWKVQQAAAIANTMAQRAQPLIDLLEPELTEMFFWRRASIGNQIQGLAGQW